MPVSRRLVRARSIASLAPHAPTVASLLEEWFAHEKRDLPWRRTYDPYHVWVSEVMLQQTRMEVVVPYFERFVARFPDLHALAAAAPGEVLALWSGLGYYRRAAMLHEGVRQVVGEHGGIIPSNVEALEKIRGIGRYTAGAIASIAFDAVAPVVDGNVQRVVARLAALEAPAGSAALSDGSWRVATELVAAAASPRMLNQALMEHGAMTCRPQSPRCDECVVASWCRGRATAQEFPRPAAAKVRVELRVPLFLVRDGDGRVLLEQHSGRLMNAMYHLPHGSDALLRDASSRFIAGRRHGAFRHSITHRNVTFELFEAEAKESIAEGHVEAIWVDPSRPLEVPHPSYVRKALALIAG